MPKVSLIIPTYNRQQILCDTLRMAVAQDYPNFEIIVVDQTTEQSDELKATLHALGDRVRYVRLRTPNLPMARNVGVRNSTGDVLVFIDDDVIIDPDYLSKHAAHYGNGSTVGGVTGLTKPVNAPSGAVMMQAYESICGVPPGLRIGDVAPAKTLVGGNTSYWRRAFLESGTSDERFSGCGWGEDTDLSMRVRRCGYELLFDSNIQIIHLAVPAGGCEIRNPALSAAVSRERTELATYLAVKNWKSLGFLTACLAIWCSYRGTALNRSNAVAGLATLCQCHLDWVGMMARIAKSVYDLRSDVMNERDQEFDSRRGVR
jgi:glycosyltransferase involved in cell wall biosynthesis